MPDSSQKVWFVTDQGTFASRVLQRRGRVLFCQVIPTYINKGQSLRFLFVYQNAMWGGTGTVSALKFSSDAFVMICKNATGPTDARQHRRYPVGVQALCTTSDQVKFAVVSMDFSPAGMRLQAPMALAVGSRIEVTLFLTGDDIVCAAYVIWSIKALDDSSLWDTGIMFVNVAEPDALRMRLWLKSRVQNVQ